MTPVPRLSRCSFGTFLVAAVLVPSLFAQTSAGHPKDPVARDAPERQRQTQKDASGAASVNGQRLARPASVALSPDGDTVAWTLITSANSRDGASLHLTSVHNPDPAKEQLVTVAGAADCTYGDPVWSPDGETLAFLSSCGAEASAQRQIYLWSKPSGQARQLTHLTGNLQQLAWSPDGKSLGFLFVENASRSAGALDAMKPFAGVIGEDGVEIQRVYAVDAQSGQGAFLSPANLHVYEFDWAPDARQIALIAANPPGENTWWIAKLFREPVQRLETSMSSAKREDSPGGTPQVVLDTNAVSGPLHGLQIAVPRWSPDGRQIAFIGGLMSDQGSTGGDLYVVDAAGGQPKDVTPGIDGSPAYEEWISDHTLSFVEDRRGHTLLTAVNVNDQKLVPGAPVDLGEVSIGGGPVKDAFSISDRLRNSKDRRLAFTMQGFSKAPEVYTATGAEGAKQLTHLNDGTRPTARTESVEWTNGPYHVQGWLTYPASYDPNASTKYPMIVTVHGGPSASVTARWGGGDWAKRGYFEFQPNPRGSFGQGEAFTAANRKDFGDGDFKDVLAGMDMIEARYPIDKTREGLTGWSYGGYMTMFGVTQTHRFRAAVAGAGLADWLSYYGENSIDQWMIPFFGASVYDDPAVYAKSSPITFIKNVQTPTLVIVGDRDGECPAPQSFEFWHALRDLGVKTQLVVYPDEGHGFRDPEHIRDRAERTAKWFADNMPVTGSTAPATTGR